MVNDTTTAPYDLLTPELILRALESVGLQPTGSLLALNSYENRVYQVGLEDNGFIIAKFYRPGRWSNEAILEEHAFADELAGQDIPIICPQRYAGDSLFESEGFRFAVYPRRGGRWPELDNPDNLQELGRLIGRIHATGRSGRFEHRPIFSVAAYGQAALDYIIEQGFVPSDMEHNLVQAAEALLTEVGQRFEQVCPPAQRIHGDFHPGNILSTGTHFHFVDLDDCCTGPVMQDLWMMLSGENVDMSLQLRELLNGYEMFCDFDYSQLALIEPLRGLRLIYYCGWLARRWHDPAFTTHFPWFNTPRYWEEQMLTFREQLERCHAPTLEVR